MPKRELLGVLRPVLLLAFGLVLVTVRRRRLADARADPVDAAGRRVRARRHRLADRRGGHERDGAPHAAAAARHAHPQRREPDQRRVGAGRVQLRRRRRWRPARSRWWQRSRHARAGRRVGGARRRHRDRLGIGAIRTGLRSTARDDPSVQTVLSVLTPFAAYLAAESVHASGILAVVAAGLYAGWNDFRDARRSDAPARVGSVGHAAVRVQRPRVPAARPHAVARAVGARRPSDWPHLRRPTRWRCGPRSR